ncbi:hypothetical protein PsYK624_085910 [Phanerochaete sordida]|uniref:Uncharacterized protein n=1 Tax=Phanerochaete sordida TaxID=48140 RepID=A0A9P3GAY3_9APHY|nr:hypothetical protein PsYK624_085910 [Phanerochaete sordida]
MPLAARQDDVDRCRGISGRRDVGLSRMGARKARALGYAFRTGQPWGHFNSQITWAPGSLATERPTSKSPNVRYLIVAFRQAVRQSRRSRIDVSGCPYAAVRNCRPRAAWARAVGGQSRLVPYGSYGRNVWPCVQRRSNGVSSPPKTHRTPFKGRGFVTEFCPAHTWSLQAARNTGMYVLSCGAAALLGCWAGGGDRPAMVTLGGLGRSLLQQI